MNNASISILRIITGALNRIHGGIIDRSEIGITVEISVGKLNFLHIEGLPRDADTLRRVGRIVHGVP